MAKILIVEDDVELSVILNDAVSALGHRVDVSYNSYDAEGLLLGSDYDLIVLDWTLPDGTGYDLCRQWRQRGISVPILFLTSKTELEAKVGALEAGAADYLTKPFDIRELVARVRALLRRPELGAGEILLAWDIEFDAAARQVRKAGQPIKLQPLEFEILQLFLRRPGYIYSVEELRSYTADDGRTSSKRAVYESIRRLRLALDTVGTKHLIGTVPGQGYRLLT